MTYNRNKFQQLYLCAYSIITYAFELFKKNLSVTFSKNSLLMASLVFILAFLVINDFNSHQYEDSFSFDDIEYENKTIVNVHKDFDPSYNSTKINSLYSQKIIEDDFFANPRMLNYIEKKMFSNKSETITSVSEATISNGKTNIIKISDIKKSDPLQIASLNWKNNFSSKKIKFIETLLPLIAYQNQKILFERERLFEIYNYLNAEKTLNEDDIVILEKMAEKYLINSKNKHKIDLIEELLQSVDIIPNSIVLAQAANESGWGSSRFAKEYNALFGQYTYDEKNGVVPFRRDEGERYLIRYFSSIDKSVESYFKNINTHYAYKKFRQIRSQMNKNNLGLNIKLLTQQLDVYAKDEFYVETINSIIETNNFMQFDFTNQFFVNS